MDEFTISNKNTAYIINGQHYINGIVNITNLAYYDDEKINRLINIFVACMRQKDFITLTGYNEAVFDNLHKNISKVKHSYFIYTSNKIIRLF